MQRQAAHVLADHLLVAVDRQQADAQLLAQAQFAGALADQARGRRHHRLGDAGARRIEQVAQVAQARGHAQELVLGEVGHLLARAHHPEHAADPDPHVRRWRQPGVVAGLERQQQRRIVQRLGVGHGHAHQRTFGADGQLEHVALDPIAAGEVALGAGRGGGLALILQLGQLAVAVEVEVKQAGRQQHHAHRRRGEHRQLFQGGHARGQVVVGRHQQVVEQDQRRVADHGQRRAHHDRRGQRQQQARHRQAAARGQARGHRQVQRHHRRVLHERGVEAGHQAGHRQQSPVLAVAAPQQPGGQAVERAGAVQAGAQHHGGHDAHHRVAGETAEDLLRRHQSADAQHHQHHQRDQVGADALEHEHGHGEPDQRQHQAHVVGQGQAGVHCAPGSLWRGGGGAARAGDGGCRSGGVGGGAHATEV